MKNLEEISKKLKQIRLNSGKSQAEFAKEIGVSQRTWSAYESGETKPKMAVMLALEKLGYVIPELTTSTVSDLKQTHTELTDERMDRVNFLARIAPEDTDAELIPLLLKKIEDGDVFNSLGKFASAGTFEGLQNFDLFKFSKGRTMPIATTEDEASAMVLLPVYGQTAAAGKGQPETQLTQVEAYIPILYEMLGGAAPKNCGIVRVVGDSMTDMNLFNGDFVIFDRTQLEGDGVYVISIGSDVRVKRLEYRPFERKIIISSENAKRYPNPEVITYEQAENLLRIHGKVICWMHRHPY